MLEPPFQNLLLVIHSPLTDGFCPSSLVANQSKGLSALAPRLYNVFPECFHFKLSIFKLICHDSKSEWISTSKAHDWNMM